MFPKSGSQGGDASGRAENQQLWEVLYRQLLEERNVDKSKEILILLEGALHKRQQELATSPPRNGNLNSASEEARIKAAFNTILDVKVKRLGFPDFREE